MLSSRVDCLVPSELSGIVGHSYAVLFSACYHSCCSACKVLSICLTGLTLRATGSGYVSKLEADIDLV